MADVPIHSHQWQYYSNRGNIIILLMALTFPNSIVQTVHLAPGIWEIFFFLPHVPSVKNSGFQIFDYELICRMVLL